MTKAHFAAALLATGFFAAMPASAQTQNSPSMTAPVQSLGGPVRQGNNCWVSNDNRGFGYWTSCGGLGAFASAGTADRSQPAPGGGDAYAAARESDATHNSGDGGSN